MKFKSKSKFVYIQPKTPLSRIMFELDLKNLHSCKVIRKEHDRILVKSIAGDYYFWINENQDSNWNFIK